MKRSRINPISKRRANENQKLRKITQELIRDNPDCQVRSRVCTGRSQCAHHKAGRIGARLLERKNLEPSCYSCNCYLETAEGKKWGYETGHRLDRLGI